MLRVHFVNSICSSNLPGRLNGSLILLGSFAVHIIILPLVSTKPSMIVSISASFITDFCFIRYAAGPFCFPFIIPSSSFFVAFLLPFSLLASPFPFSQLLVSLSTTITPLPASPVIPIPIIPFNKLALVAFIAAAALEIAGFSLIESNILSNSSITYSLLCVGICLPLI